MKILEFKSAMVLLSGVVIGTLITCLFASLAVERRDAVVISIYHGQEGLRSQQAEQIGQMLDAYAHQANMVAIMEQQKETLGLDLVPWSFWAPFTGTAQALIVPTPGNNWSEAAIRAQRSRLAKLKAESNGPGSDKI